MDCWNCKQKHNTNTVTFRTVCEFCLSFLHCCQGCKFHEEGRNNQCQIPGTDPIRDREANNYCEEFYPKTNNLPNNSTKSLSEAEKFLGVSLNKPKKLIID